MIREAHACFALTGIPTAMLSIAADSLVNSADTGSPSGRKQPVTVSGEWLLYAETSRSDTRI